MATKNNPLALKTAQDLLNEVTQPKPPAPVKTEENISRPTPMLPGKDATVKPLDQTKPKLTEPVYHRDKTGHITHTELPDGRVLQTTGWRSAAAVANAWKNSHGTTPQTIPGQVSGSVPGQQPPVPGTETLTTGVAGDATQVGAEFTDPLSQDIARNVQGIQDLNQGLTYSGSPQENAQQNARVMLNTIMSPSVKILNKASFGFRAGDALADLLTTDDEIERVMTGFSTGGNIKQIRENLEMAEDLQQLSIKQARTDPIKAKLNYEAAQSRKFKSLIQLKTISRNDPREFVNLRKEIEVLEDYFDETKGIKVMDDLALNEALNTG